MHTLAGKVFINGPLTKLIFSIINMKKVSKNLKLERQPNTDKILCQYTSEFYLLPSTLSYHISKNPKAIKSLKTFLSMVIRRLCVM